MAYTGTGLLGTTLIGQGSGRGGTFSPIGTSSGLATHGILLSQGLGAFTSVTPSSTSGTILQSRGAASDPQYSTAAYPITAGTSGNVITSDGTNFVSQAAAAGGFSVINVQVFTTPGANTYTPTASMKYCIIEVVGGGGGGGATTTCPGTQVSAAGGGGGGGYARKFASAATIGVSQTATVGAAGAVGAVAGGTGGTGGTSSLGAIVSATGGLGGVGSGTASQANSAGGAGGAGSSGDFNTTGQPGGTSSGVFVPATGAFALSGYGGSSFYGGGGLAICLINTAAAGNAGSSYGGGGSGSACGIGATQQVGGIGVAGIVVVTEFI